MSDSTMEGSSTSWPPVWTIFVTVDSPNWSYKEATCTDNKLEVIRAQRPYPRPLLHPTIAGKGNTDRDLVEPYKTTRRTVVKP
jgi:hypothetical protein